MERIGGSKHCAAVVYKNRVISLGRNQLKTHPLMRSFQSTSYKIYLHAEIDAIQKAIRMHDESFLRDCEMYVLRITRGGNIGYSKPCVGCQRAITNYGFRKVVFTCDEGELQSIAA